MTEQPDLATLLREASEGLAEAQDKLDAAQLLEREPREKVEEKMGAAVHAFCELGDLLQERKP
jgi:hypothetical protein